LFEPIKRILSLQKRSVYLQAFLRFMTLTNTRKSFFLNPLCPDRGQTVPHYEFFIGNTNADKTLHFNKNKSTGDAQV